MAEATEIQVRGPVLPRRRPAVGAFFDMDKTLIAENSGAVYVKHQWEQGDIDTVAALKGLGAYLQYKVGILDIDAWTKRMMLDFRGRRVADLEKEAEQLFHERIIDSVYPQARELIEWHKSQGHVVAIVSGGVKFVVEPLAAHLGLDHCLYTRLEVENGCFTGRVIEPICFEEGKIYWLQQFIQDQRIDLARSWFYTDSVTDLPLLEMVGHPVVANPDPMLLRVAVKRKWPVRYFELPGEA